MTKAQAVTDGSKSSGARNFTQLLDALVEETSGDQVTLKQLMEVAGHRSFGPVLLLLGLVAVSPLTVVPGATWIVAMVTLLFASQIVFGRKQPWLPKKLVEAKFPRSLLEKTVNSAAGVAHIADKLTAPRLTFLTEPPFVVGTALLCVIAALITFPLGLIPFAPLLPGIAIMLVGIGLTARDGVFLMLSMLCLAGGGMLVYRWLF